MPRDGVAGLHVPEAGRDPTTFDESLVDRDHADTVVEPHGQSRAAAEASRNQMFMQGAGPTSSAPLTAGGS